MSSDVVRWFMLSSQQNESGRSTLIHSNTMTAIPIQSNRKHRLHSSRRSSYSTNTITSTIALGRHLTSKFILLTIWLVINQCVNVALSEPIVSANYLNYAIEDNASGGNNDLDELVRIHRTHGDHHHDSQAYSHDWVIEVKDGETADEIAAHHGYTNLGKVSSLPLYFYLFYSLNESNDILWVFI